MIFIRKNFYLASTFDISRGKPAIDDLNNLLECVGVNFQIKEIKKGHKKIFIEVNEEKLRDAISTKESKKIGRPTEHEFDFDQIEKMKANGKTNTEIYKELGMSKSLFYLRMKEYKNNIVHVKENHNNDRI